MRGPRYIDDMWMRVPASVYGEQIPSYRETDIVGWRSDNPSRLVMMRGSLYAMRGKYNAKYGYSADVLERWARMKKYTSTLDSAGQLVTKIAKKHYLNGPSWRSLERDFGGHSNRDVVWIAGRKVYVDSISIDQCVVIGQMRRQAEKLRALGAI